jgi:hypothetical protein
MPRCRRGGPQQGVGAGESGGGPKRGHFVGQESNLVLARRPPAAAIARGGGAEELGERVAQRREGAFGEDAGLGIHQRGREPDELDDPLGLRIDAEDQLRQHPVMRAGIGERCGIRAVADRPERLHPGGKQAAGAVRGVEDAGGGGHDQLCELAVLALTDLVLELGDTGRARCGIGRAGERGELAVEGIGPVELAAQVVGREFRDRVGSFRAFGAEQLSKLRAGVGRMLGENPFDRGLGHDALVREREGKIERIDGVKRVELAEQARRGFGVKLARSLEIAEALVRHGKNGRRNQARDHEPVILGVPRQTARRGDRLRRAFPIAVLHREDRFGGHQAAQRSHRHEVWNRKLEPARAIELEVASRRRGRLASHVEGGTDPLERRPHLGRRGLASESPVVDELKIVPTRFVRAVPGGVGPPGLVEPCDGPPVGVGRVCGRRVGRGQACDQHDGQDEQDALHASHDTEGSAQGFRESRDTIDIDERGFRAAIGLAMNAVRVMRRPRPTLPAGAVMGPTGNSGLGRPGWTRVPFDGQARGHSPSSSRVGRGPTFHARVVSGVICANRDLTHPAHGVQACGRQR